MSQEVAKLKVEQSGQTLARVNRVEIEAHKVTITMDPLWMADLMGQSPDTFDLAELTWSAPLSLKRRGDKTHLFVSPRGTPHPSPSENAREFQSELNIYIDELIVADRGSSEQKV